MTPQRQLRSPLFALSLLASSSFTTTAWACGTCSAGSPAFTTAGQGQPVAGRIRGFFELQLRREESKRSGALRRQLVELRSDFGVVFAPTDRLWLSARLPLAFRDGRWENRRELSTIGVSDLEARARYVLFRDREFAPQHLLGVIGGIQLPTALDHHGRDGERLPTSVQSGSGTLDVIGGGFYTLLDDPWAVFVDVEARAPTLRRYQESPGPRVEARFLGQLRLDALVSLRAGAELLASAPGLVGQRRDPDSSSLRAYLTPSLLLMPSPDWLLLIGARIPIANHSTGVLKESPTALLSVVFDV